MTKPYPFKNTPATIDSPIVLNRNHSDWGTYTGITRFCTLTGCNGRRMGVRWRDGKITWPCSKGIIQASKTVHHIG